MSIKCLIKSLVIIIFNKLKYGKNIDVDSHQNFEDKINIDIFNNGNIIIGRGAHIRSGLYLCADGGKLEIGETFFANRNVSISAMSTIKIGKNVKIANNVVIVDHDHDYKKGEGFIIDSVFIGDGAWIGANSVILRGSNIGANSVIAAGSIVKGNVPDNSLYLNGKLSGINL